MPSEDHFTYPECGRGISFSKAEWERAQQAVERLRSKAATRCRHLVRDGKKLATPEAVKVVPLSTKKRPVVRGRRVKTEQPTVPESKKPQDPVE